MSVTMLDPASELQIPLPTHQSSARSIGKSMEDSSTMDPSIQSTSAPTTIHPCNEDTGRAQPLTSMPSEDSLRTRQDTESDSGDSCDKIGRSATPLRMIIYLLLSVPGLALLSFFYTLLTIPVLVISRLILRNSLTEKILSGHQALFQPHARMMHVQSPKLIKDIIALGLGTLPISILVFFGGLFAVASQFYSILLSENDRSHRSLNRVASLWASWLCLFSADERVVDKDDIV